MIQRRCFSSTAVAFGKRRQLAIQKKKGNIARQAVLKAEREPANFDPILGSPTEFTRGILTPNGVWASKTNIGDSLYFPKEELTQIQSAVAEAFVARERAETSYEAPTTYNPFDEEGEMGTPAELDEAEFGESKLLTEQLDKLREANVHNSEASARIVSLRNSNARTLRAWNTAYAIKQFARSEGDTGSSEVQAAVLTARILAEFGHFAKNKKDNSGFRGFRMLVQQRQRTLKYLRRESVDRYFACIERLGLSDQAVTKEIVL